MNCFYHNDRTIVAVCQDCNKGLCYTCTSQHSTPICIACNSLRKSSVTHKVWKELILTFGFGITLTMLLSQSRAINTQLSSTSTVSLQLAMFYVYSGLVAGWLTLSKITPRIFLILPLIGWVFYFAIKLTLSMWIGVVMLPVRTFGNVRTLLRMRE